MGNRLYKIGFHKILYWIGRSICWVARWICRFGSLLKWIWLHRQLQEVLQMTLDDLPKGGFEKVSNFPGYDILRLWRKEDNG